MLLPRFEYHAPKTQAEALEMLARFGAKARILAGGTDLLVNLKTGRDKAAEVVSIHRLKNLAGISRSKSGTKIGPLTGIAELASQADLGPASFLGRAASKLGSPLIRNRATLGGNIASSRPAADTAPPLLALGAKARLKSASGQRTVDLVEFFTGPGQNVIGPDEILTGLIIPPLPQGSGGGYEKLGARKALEISIVNVAAFLSLEKDGTIKTARIALGAVGPTPLRAFEAENLLVGEKPKGPNDAIFHGAGTAAVGNSCAIDDLRGTAVYRCRMVEVLTRRALSQAYTEAMEG